MQHSVRPDEIARFDTLAATWWDPAGPMAPLHAMNPLRTQWIDARLDRTTTLLDLGCGAGLASEALAGFGHTVLGLDAASALIQAATLHAEGQALPLTYRHATAETLIAEGLTFGAVTALEVIEHVTDPVAFLVLLARLVQPGGRVFISTLNRTVRSLAVAKIGAEYIARLLPRGTHDWRQFVTPAELLRDARAAGLKPVATTGMTYDLRRRTWTLSADLGINYMAEFTRLS